MTGQLHACYTDAVRRKDYGAFGDCFTEDAEWRITGMVLRGRVEIVDTIKQLMSRFRRVLVTPRIPNLFDDPDYGPPAGMPPFDAPTCNHSKVALSRDAK
jgi:SnoaL-like domain